MSARTRTPAALFLLTLGLARPVLSQVDPCPAAWTRVGTPGPPARAAHGMAYDAARGQTVIFGGVGDLFGTLNLGDTWGFDGTRWTRLAAAGPEPRRDGLLAFDAARGRVVLWGGSDTELIDGNRYFGETWEWDGSTWSIRARIGPPGRTAHGMAYDALRGRVVMFGGDADHVPSAPFVWEWDGSAWSRIETTGPTPGPRLSPLMAFDARRGRVVLHGGYDVASGGFAADTWEWDGAAWTRLAVPGPQPANRTGAALAYDAGREALVLFGGSDPDERLISGLWELDSSGWHSLEVGPTPRLSPSMAYDPDRGRLVLFGGITRSDGAFGDTWRRAAAVTADRLVPIALDVATSTARFTTELSLTNRGDRDAEVTLSYTAALGSGTGSVVERVPAGRQVVIADALAYLRGKGLAIPSADVAQQAGTLLVSFGCAAGQDSVSVTARTTTPTLPPLPAGAAGLSYGGVRIGPPADRLVVHGLRAGPTDRSNVAVYSTSRDPVTVRITALSGLPDGARVPIAEALALAPFQWAQFPFGETGLVNGRVLVERVSGSGGFGAYGVVNDNVTNDGSFVTATLAGDASPAPRAWMVPVLVETASFESELVLANAGDAPVGLELSYRESLGPAGSGTIPLALAAGEQRLIPSALDFLRRSGLPLGVAGSVSRAGGLRVRVVSGSGAGVWLAARTASVSLGGGRFGLFTPAVPAEGAPADEGVVYGLLADATTRSNLGAVNAGAPEAGPVELQVQLFDGRDGLPKGDATTLRLEPGQWSQIDRALAPAGIPSGWARVRRVSGTAPWLAYGVLNDGGEPGQRTGDGAYVPMVKPGGR